MKCNKSSILFVSSLICFAVFIISFFKLILGDASDASQNYGFSLSIIAGIVIAIPTIIEIIKQYKSTKKNSLISFAIGCFKKENGKELYHLVMALFFSLFPVVILIGVLFLCSDNNNTSASSKSNGQINKTAGNFNNNTVRTHNPSDEMTNQEVNKIATSSANDIKFLSDAQHNQIQKIFKENPGISDEDALERFRKNNPGQATLETIRTHKPM